MSQLPLHDSRGCTVCEQGTSRTVPHRMESAARNFQRIQKRVQLLLSQLVGREWPAAPIDEKQITLTVMPLEVSA
jgi:hypothetical protein